MIALRIDPAMLMRESQRLLVVGGVACLLLLVLGIFTPEAGLRSVLFAWLYWLGIAAGGMVLLGIHAMTGGAWGDEGRIAFAVPARSLFAIALLFVIVMLGMSSLYPWARHPGAVGADVAQLYLNPAWFAARGIVVLAAWSAMGLILGRSVPPAAVWAGLLLVVYYLTVAVAAFDWSASQLPQWASSAQGMIVGVLQVTSAIAFANVVGVSRSTRATRDLAGMLIAGILGLTYLAFMELVVIWASGVPEKAAWYGQRQHAADLAVLGLAFLVGAVVPFVLLLRASARDDPAWTAVAGWCVLVGTALYWAWQIPGRTIADAGLQPLALIGIGALWLGVAFGFVGEENRLGGRRDDSTDAREVRSRG